MIKIIENAIPVTLQNYIEHVMLGSTIPWNFIPGITGGIRFNAEPDEIDGWAYLIRKQGQPMSPMDDLAMCIILVAADKAGVDVEFVERIRAGLFTPIGKELGHSPHIDYQYPHLAMLYYVTDSDGPTVFYDDHNNIIETVDPKKGTAVIFDGLIRHASSSPVEYRRRIVINYNFNPAYNQKPNDTIA